MRLIASILLLAALPLWYMAEKFSFLPEHLRFLQSIEPSVLFSAVLVFFLWSLYEAYRMSAGLLDVTKITRELTASLEQLKTHEREARVQLEQRCAELEEEKISLRKELVSGASRQAVPQQSAAISPAQESRSAENEVISLLALLQEKGRFLDFLEQDLVSVSNEQLGVVSRVVHAGCKEVIAKFVTLEPLADKAEGDQMELTSGYDPGSWRLLGHVRDNPPYRGTILHRGWKIVRLSPNSLPERKQGNSVLYPAELQVQAA